MSAPDIHINLNVRGLPQSATLAINERSAQLQKEGRVVFRFGLGQSPFPVPSAVVEALQANAHQKDYLAVKGLYELRQAIAEYHRRRQGVDFSPDDILVGPGSKELMFLLQLVYYGDLVIPTPSWVSYAPQATIVGRQIRWIPTREENDWAMTPQELEKVCATDPGRPRIVILCYPNNPTGGTYDRENLEAIAEVARKYRVVLLSDEIYGELEHEGRHVSIARFYPEGTIVSTGLSKWCGAGGWRLGCFAFPQSMRWLLDGMAVAASETFTSTSAPIQHAAIRAFEGGMDIERYLGTSRRVLRALSKHLVSMVRGAGIQVAEPRGAFYMLVDLEPFRSQLVARGIEDSETMCTRLLEEVGVAILPGSCFGRPPHELTARIAFVDFDGAAALAACDALPPGEEPDASFLELFCGKVLHGFERLCAWARGEA